MKTRFDVCHLRKYSTIHGVFRRGSQSIHAVLRGSRVFLASSRHFESGELLTEMELVSEWCHAHVMYYSSVGYYFSCDLCDVDYVSYTAHATFTNALLNINRPRLAHGDVNLLKASHFRILRKCEGKFDCWI